MEKRMRVTAAAVAVALMTSGCFGSFNLVRKVYKFNQEVSSEKWVRELAYLLMSYIPVYGVAGLADSLIFNSIEFWTGSNPISMADHSGPRTKRIVRRDAETILTGQSTDAGKELLIQQLRNGQLSSSVKIQQRDGGLVAIDETGRAVLSAQTLADGSVQVSDAQGKQVARYTAEQSERLLKSIR